MKSLNKNFRQRNTAMNPIKTYLSIADFNKMRAELPITTTIGFVPTMGALHPGHASLIQRSHRENELTVVSIFVNPTQFNNPEDLKKYPRTWDNDVKIAAEAGAQIILSPTFDEIYPDNYKYKLCENNFSMQLCGAHRPGHFDGVLTVVMKLLNIVRPQAAYFGEKDFQQLTLIKKMAEAFFMQTQIYPCPTLREHDGLAMSSRNVRLTPTGRKKAPLIYQALTNFSDSLQARNFLESSDIQVEYLEEHENRRYIAAFIDGVRLIDNVAI